MGDTLERFTIHVDDRVLDDLRARLALTRFPDQIAETGWEYGIPVDYVRDLVGYWRNRYDWRTHEARLNELDHFRTEIDGQPIHFVHARSTAADAFPLLLTHGWPGSVVEFLDVIPLLTAPGDGIAFDVVAPSLPGYAFSGPTHTRGWDVSRIARAFAALMDRLGYERYGAQGGDWGAQVATRIGALDTGHVISGLVGIAPQRGLDELDPSAGPAQGGGVVGAVDGTHFGHCAKLSLERPHCRPGCAGAR